MSKRCQRAVRIFVRHIRNVLLPSSHACQRPYLRYVLASSTIMFWSIPLATHRLLPSRVTLLSDATMRRLRRPDAPSRHPCLELGWQYLNAFLRFAVAGKGKVPHNPGRCSAGFIPFRALFSSRRGRPSQVPGIPQYTSAPLSDPGWASLAIALAANAMLPPLTRSGRPQQSSKFRGSIMRLRYSLHTLRAALTERLRNARFRLVANLCRVGVFTHWVSTVSFIMLRFHKSRYTGLGLSRRVFSGSPSPIRAQFE
jgi:hypothetical protein